MIYITGDMHNTIDMSNISTKKLKNYCYWQKDDDKNITYLIILGDFGLPWFDCPIDEKGIHPENKQDQYLLRWLKKKPFTILAVMGNHENYNMIEKLPEVEMFGDKVLKVSENIFYLKRGHFYNIEEKSFLVLGGAESHDKEFRKLNVSHWEQELWSDEEEQSCLNRIEEHGRTADYILSHTGPIEGISLIESSCDDPKYRELYRMDKTVRFNDKINEIISYKKWFFGHWHTSWGYDHRKHSKFIPLFTAGIVLDSLEEK